MPCCISLPYNHRRHGFRNLLFQNKQFPNITCQDNAVERNNVEAQKRKEKKKRKKKERKRTARLRKLTVLQLSSCLRPSWGGKRYFLSIWRTLSLEKRLIPPMWSLREIRLSTMEFGCIFVTKDPFLCWGKLVNSTSNTIKTNYIHLWKSPTPAHYVLNIKSKLL